MMRGATATVLFAALVGLQLWQLSDTVAAVVGDTGRESLTRGRGVLPRSAVVVNNPGPAKQVPSHHWPVRVVPLELVPPSS